MFNRAEDEVGDAPAAALVELIRQQRGHMTLGQRVEGARVVIDRLSARQSDRRFSTWRWVTAPVALVVFLTAALALQRYKASALSYTVYGGHVQASGLVEADPAAQPRLRFSDGSEVQLSSGAKALVREVDGHGARVSLTDGSAHVDIAHVPGAHWLFDAGPFLVAVTGTAFTVSWKPEDEQLDVQMERGSVGVSGPLFDGALPLRSGQHLIVRVRQRETFVRDFGTEAVAVTAPTPAPAGAETASSSVVANAAPSGRVAAKALIRTLAPSLNHGWAGKVAAGDFESVVQEAEQTGLDACLSDATSADLAALADAARYARHGDVARRSLLAERRRFPLSRSARDACFLLGRLEETDQNDSPAIDWYDAYLAESPGGTYASEALGRKMELTFRRFGGDRARTMAGEYLKRFPQGTYAERARALYRSP